MQSRKELAVAGQWSQPTWTGYVDTYRPSPSIFSPNPSVGYSTCGRWPWLFQGKWNLPGLGIKPVSPALAGAFFFFFFLFFNWRIIALQNFVFFSVKPQHESAIGIHMKVKVKLLSHVWLFVTPWTVAYQPLLTMGFSRQEYWSGLPFPPPGDHSDPGIKPKSPAL